MGKMWNVFLQNGQNHNRQCPHVEKKNKENNPYGWPVADVYFLEIIKRLLILYNQK